MKITCKFGLITSISCMLSVLAMASSDFYKWTDPQGVVHYSETPPKDKSQPAELIKAKSAHAPLPEVNSGKPDDAGEEEGSETSASEANANAEAKPVEKVDQILKKDPEACRQATDAYNSLMSKPIIRRDGKVMTIEEKNLELKRTKEVMDVHC